MTEQEHRIFIVSVSFFAPMEGTFQIAASDLEHARAIITEQFKNRDKLNIVSIIDAASIAPIHIDSDPSENPPVQVH